MGVEKHRHHPFPLRRLLVYVLVTAAALGLLIDRTPPASDSPLAHQHG